MEQQEKKMAYFQYLPEAKLPIYVCYPTEVFDEEDLPAFLTAMKFEKLEDKKAQEQISQDRKNPHFRMLNISEASTRVARQIDQARESDKYGFESVLPNNGYKIYRFKEIALMIFSFAAREWEMACFSDFGTQSSELAYRTVLNRFLSWSLSPMGIIGFWGVPVEEGVVILKHSDAQGEVIFIDVRKRKLLTQDGLQKMRSRFKIIRLDPKLKGRNIKMRAEELLSFLTVHCSYFDYQGLTVPLRQVIQAIAKNNDGILHPEESFKPRTDLTA